MERISAHSEILNPVSMGKCFHYDPLPPLRTSFSCPDSSWCGIVTANSKRPVSHKTNFLLLFVGTYSLFSKHSVLSINKIATDTATTSMIAKSRIFGW